MSMENTPVDTNDDLDTFEADFFGQKQTPSEEANSEVVEDVTDVDAPNTTDTQEVDTLPENDEDETEETGADEEHEEAPKKKNRFQERIDEVVGKQREAERRAAELERKLQETLARLEGPAPKAEEPKSGPTPEDKNEDGTEKYPLGEFDPSYLRDLTKHILSEEKEAMRVEAETKAQQAQLETERLGLQASWENKLEPAQERYPDFIEKSAELINGFSDLDPVYGDYIASQIMDLEYGPDVLYYLANNPTEARSIVESGARKATVALGRLDAKFSFAEEEKQRRPKVSQAPVPPPTNKGAAAAKIEIKGDTDDLDAFEKTFFKNRR